MPVPCHLFIELLFTLAPLLCSSVLIHELLGLLRLAPPSGEFKLKLAVESIVHYCTYYLDTTPYGVFIDGRSVGRRWLGRRE